MEQLDPQKVQAFEQNLNCRFCEDGVFAEMSMPLGEYREKTAPIEGVTYGFFTGDLAELHKAVAQVDASWVQYYTPGTPVLCGFINGKVVSFCIVEEDPACIIAAPGLRIGSIGCVGTLPEYRGHGIGLRMVDLATVHIQSMGCHRGYISYTAIDHWYAKLGYRVFARFSFLPKANS